MSDGNWLRMGEPEAGLAPGDGPAESRLLDAARAGDRSAFERLYAPHAESARRLAVLLAGPDDADDLVSESVSRVLKQLVDGHGPTTNFRAYLHATIRNRHRDTLRGARERPSSDLPWILDGEEPRAEDLVEGIDSNGAVAALASLPSTWQRILWLLEVEGHKPAEVAALLDTTPAAISSLAYRARDGLKRAYIDHAVAANQPRPECRWTRSRLSQYVRGDLSPRTSAKVEDHTTGCAECSAVLEDMRQLNDRLAAFLFPVVLVGGMKVLDAGAAAPFVGGTTDHHGTQAGAPGRALAGSTLGPVRSVLAGKAPAVAAVAAIALTGIVGTLWAVTRDDPAPTAVPRSLGGTSTAVDRPVHSGPSPAVHQPTPTPPTDGVVGPDPADTDDGPVVVTATAPDARVITACGTFGALSIPDVTGVRYTRVKGDGRQGRWVVLAAARSGFTLADGSPTRFSGDLGRHVVCPPSIAGTTKVSQGDPATDPWDITVRVRVNDSTSSTLQVVYAFDTGALITARSGAGWVCKEPGGTEVGVGTEYSFPDPVTITCTRTGSGTVPPVTLSAYGQDSNSQIVNPTGTVQLLRDGAVLDSQSFA